MIVRGCGCLLVFVLLLAASGVSIGRALLPPLDAAQPDAVPTPIVDRPVRGPLPGLIVYVNTPELNLRAAPGTDQDVLAVLPERMAVRTLGQGERRGDLIWIDVHVPDLDLDGWVAKPYLSIVQPYRAPYYAACAHVSHACVAQTQHVYVQPQRSDVRRGSLHAALPLTRCCWCYAAAPSRASRVVRSSSNRP